MKNPSVPIKLKLNQLQDLSAPNLSDPFMEVNEMLTVYLYSYTVEATLSRGANVYSSSTIPAAVLVCLKTVSILIIFGASV